MPVFFIMISLRRYIFRTLVFAAHNICDSYDGSSSSNGNGIGDAGALNAYYYLHGCGTTHSFRRSFRIIIHTRAVGAPDG